MRVISGKYKKCSLDGYNLEGTRPTMDRIKESMFALIQDKIKDSICLDLFAGSGALGIEALSNGAKCCYFVDNSSLAINTIKKNINSIRVTEPYYVIARDYKNALKYFQDQNIKFDLIFLDPPYKFDFINQVLDFLIKYELLSDDSIIICEYESEVFNNENFIITKERKYGSKKVVVLQKRN